MFPMLSELFIKGDNGWVVLAHKTISVSLTEQNITESLLRLKKHKAHRLNDLGSIGEGLDGGLVFTSHV